MPPPPALGAASWKGGGGRGEGGWGPGPPSAPPSLSAIGEKFEGRGEGVTPLPPLEFGHLTRLGVGFGTQEGNRGLVQNLLNNISFLKTHQFPTQSPRVRHVERRTPLTPDDFIQGHGGGVLGLERRPLLALPPPPSGGGGSCSWLPETHLASVFLNDPKRRKRVQRPAAKRAVG